MSLPNGDFGSIEVQSQCLGPAAAPEERAAARSRWEMSVDRSAASGQPLAGEDALDMMADALALGDLRRLSKILAAPTQPIAWEPERGPSPFGEGFLSRARGTGLRELEASPRHPIQTALRMAAAGSELGMAALEAMLAAAAPTLKARAMEAAAALGSAAAFDAVLDSVEFAPEPEGGWQAVSIRASDGMLLESYFGEGPLGQARVYPFGRAFEAAMSTGFVHAIERMGALAGRQSTADGAKPDRLLSRSALEACIEKCPDPIPSLLAGMEFADLRSSLRPSLDGLLASPRAKALPTGQLRAIREAMSAKLDEIALREQIPAPPSSGALGPAMRI